MLAMLDIVASAANYYHQEHHLSLLVHRGLEKQAMYFVKNVIDRYV